MEIWAKDLQHRLKGIKQNAGYNCGVKYNVISGLRGDIL